MWSVPLMSPVGDGRRRPEDHHEEDGGLVVALEDHDGEGDPGHRRHRLQACDERPTAARTGALRATTLPIRVTVAGFEPVG
ncbi:MAG: hypothetical protein ACT4PW_08815 [Acidimicrobiia bacterium]